MKHIPLLPRLIRIVLIFSLFLARHSFSDGGSLFTPSPVRAQTCTSYDELIDGSGWEYHGDISDGGKLVFFSDDSELPVGYEAIGDGWDIHISNPDRFMPSGWWSIYRVCTADVGAPDESCPTIDALLDSHGWRGVEETGDGGVVVQLFVPDALPWGYEAIGEDWQISLDNLERYMPAGFWSVYRVACE